MHLAEAGRVVIGHGDWSVKHFRFRGLRPTVIYDWDSLSCDLETILVGGAAATFAYTEAFDVDVWASLEEALAFVSEYEEARAKPFTDAERRGVHASIVYSRAYSARCTHAVRGDAQSLGLRELPEALL